MADINLLNMNHLTQKPNAVEQFRTPQPVKAEQVQSKTEDVEQKDKLADKKEIQQPQLENVVAESDFGDTVQVSEEGQEKLEADGAPKEQQESVRNINLPVSASAEKNAVNEKEEQTAVAASDEKSAYEEVKEQQAERAEFVKEQQAKRAEQIKEQQAKRAEQMKEQQAKHAEQMKERQAKRVELAEEHSKEKNKVQIKVEDIEDSKESKQDQGDQDVPDSFAGYSKAQVKQMYQEGKISEYQYESVAKSREQQEDAEKEEQAKLSNQLGKAVTLTEKAERSAAVIEQAFSDDASQKIAPKTRVEAMEQIDKAGNLDNEAKNQATALDAARETKMKIVVE